MGKQTRALLVVALVAIVLVILQALSGGSTQPPTALTAGDASALEPLIELPPPSNSTSWHVLPGEYRELFSTMVSVDVNVGNMYDLKQLSRQRTACESDVGRSANCTGAFEPMTAFVARCAAACIAIGGDGLECTAFVMLYEGECVLKRFLLTHRLERPDAVSFVRRVPYAGSSPDILSYNFRTVEDSQFRRKIGFAVLTSVVHLHTRLLPALQTWLCHADAVLLLEDDALSREAVKHLLARSSTSGGAAVLQSGNGAPFWGSKPSSSSSSSPASMTSLSNITLPLECLVGKHFVFESPPEDGMVRSYNGAWKNFPLISHVYRHLPLKAWYMMVDDDSFVISHNLNVLIHSVFERVVSPQNRAMMFGAIFRVGGTKELFVQGGAGILMTRAAVQLFRRAVAPPQQRNATGGQGNVTVTRRDGVPQCYEWCQQWAGDVRLGCCARLLGVALKHDFTFWSEDAATSIATRQSYSYFPTTMHQMKDPDVVKDMYAAVRSVTESTLACGHHHRCMNTTSAHASLPAEMMVAADHGTPSGNLRTHVPLYWEPLVHYLQNVSNVSWLAPRG